jgi:UDP-N-acetylmuramyl pentapeptide phosphotransferase/UDP-N-acetylglucosamine-1-phosphate transferase
MITNWIFLAAVSAIASWILIAAIRPWLTAHGMAHPNERSSHAQSTPQGAGIAVVLVALLAGGSAVQLYSSVPVGVSTHLVLVATAALAILGVGCLDDIYELPIFPRFAVQAAAIAAVVLSLPAEFRILPDILSLVAERSLIAIGGLWFLNLYNFMDGVDLIAATETMAIALCVTVTAALGMAPNWMGWAAAALAGATLGFVPWNWPPARIFLGNSGSLAIGFLIGVLLLHLAAARGPAAALIIPLYFIMDATITLVRRMVRREAFWLGHKTHFYQRALQNGWSVRRIVTVVTVLNAILIGLAVVAAASPDRLSSGSALTVAIAAVAIVLYLFARHR